MTNVTGQRQGSVITALLPCVKIATNHSNCVFPAWRNMKINKDDYEIVKFSTKVTNTTTRKSGYKIGDFLIVGYADSRRNSWRIYRSQDGLECLGTTFETSEDAIQCAEWIREHYGYYFFIWTAYPRAELYRWTYLTIENGEKYMNVLESIEDQRNVRWEDVLQQLS